MTLRDKTINGVKWTSISSIIKTVLQLFQLIILARYLSAEDFGLVAIVMVVIGFSQLFMDMGISNAIIHTQNITEIQLSSLYWLNIFSGIILTIIVFLSAPLISLFYKEGAITPLIQLLSISFIINSIGNQYRVLLRKYLKFNILARVEVLAVIGAFITAVILAIQGFGAYSLVDATLASAIISNSILIAIGIKTHKPRLVYHHDEIKSFLTFGLYQMGQNSIVYFNKQFDVILIGKLLGVEVLGVYNLTKQLVMKPAQVINPIITNVTFPVMAKIQDDLDRLKSVYLKITNFISSINFPIYLLMIILASELVPLILSENWSNSIEIFQILSITFLIRSIMSPAGSLLLAKGRADIGFWWSAVELIFTPLAIYVGSLWGILGVSFALLSFQIVFLVPNWYFIVYKICRASFNEYIKQIYIPILVSIFSMLLTYMVLFNFEMESFSYILSWFLFGFIFYGIFSFLLNKVFFTEIKNLILRKKSD